MNRRTFLIAAALVLAPVAAQADEDYVGNLVRLLKKQGFGDIAVTRTFLGRVRIVASNSKQKREVICNPRTGEILRDVMIDPDGSTPTANEDSGTNSGSSGGGDQSGGTGDDGGNDGGHDDGNDGGDDGGGGDNSGHGSDGSGNGGDDNSGHGSGHD